MGSDLQVVPGGAMANPQNAVAHYSKEQLQVLKDVAGGNLSNAELMLYLEYCRALGVDPFTGMVYPIKRWDSEKNKEVLKFQSGIDCMRSIAEDTGEKDGQEEYWCGPDGVWQELWLDSKPPAAAKCVVYRKGCAKPFIGIARFDAYCQKKKSGEPTKFWAGPMASNQLAKCAESLALRKAFAKKLGRLYSTEEMEQSRKDDAESAVQHQQAIARDKIQELEAHSSRASGEGGDDALLGSTSPPDIPELIDDEIPTGQPRSGGRANTRKSGASGGITAAQIRFQEELKPVKEAYLLVGTEEGYRAIVRSFGVEKSKDITVREDQVKFIKALKGAAFELEMRACGAGLYVNPQWLALFPDEQTAIRQCNFVYWVGRKAKNTQEKVEAVCAEQIAKGFTAKEIGEFWTSWNLEVEAKLKENHEKQ